MAKLGMDYRGFKKIASDKNTTTLKHIKEGHEIRLAHSALKPEMKANLDKLPFHKMADGGEAELPGRSPASDPIDSTPAIPTSEPTPQPSSAPVEDTKSFMDTLAPPHSPQYGQDTTEETPATTTQEVANVKDPVMQQQQVQDPYGFNDYEKGMQGNLDKQLAGQTAVQSAQGTMGKEVAAAQEEKGNADVQAADDYAKARLPIDQKSQELQKWLNDNPENAGNYMKKLSTGGKIQTAIGLLLGGIGSGMTHGPDMAAQYLQKQIDNDLESQRSNIGTHKGLLAHNMQEGMNARDAYNMAKIQNNEALMGALGVAQGKAQNAQAMGAIQNTQGIIGMETEKLKHDMTMQRMQFGGASGVQDPAHLAVALIKDPADRKASLEEIKNATNLTTNGPKILELFEKAQNTLNTADFIPPMDNVYQKGIKQLLLPNFKTIDGTVRQAPMEETYHNVIPQFGDSKNTTDEKRKYLTNWMISESDAPFSRGHGVDLKKFPTTNLGFMNQGIKQQPGVQQYEQRIINGKYYHVPVGK